MKRLFLVLILIIYLCDYSQAMEMTHFHEPNPDTINIECILKYKFKCFVVEKDEKIVLGDICSKLDAIMEKLPEPVECLFFKHCNIVAYNTHRVLKVTFTIKFEKNKIETTFNPVYNLNEILPKKKMSQLNEFERGLNRILIHLKEELIKQILPYIIKSQDGNLIKLKLLFFIERLDEKITL